MIHCGSAEDYPPGYPAVEFHPLTAPMFHNATKSPLASLPDDIIFRIMSFADDVGLFCLRRTCRTMLRLFSDARFLRLHDDRSDVRWISRYYREPDDNELRPNAEPIAWRRTKDLPWKRERLTEKNRAVLLPLLRRDLYCETCRTVDPGVESRLQNEHLYCSGCKISHPAGLFSYEQRRRQDDDSSRLCIGREGHIRVCEHRTVSWDDVEMYRSSGYLHKRQHDCRHPDHFSNHPPPGSPLPCPGEDVWAQGVFVRFWAFRTVQKWTASPSCRWGLGHRPALTIRRHLHLSIPNLGQANKLDYVDLLAQTEWLRASGGASYIFGDKPGRSPLEMIPFDPNFCSCVNVPRAPHAGNSNNDDDDDKNAAGWVFSNRGYPSNQCPVHGRGGAATLPPSGLHAGRQSSEKEWYQDHCLRKTFVRSLRFFPCKARPHECLEICYHKTIPLAPCRSIWHSLCSLIWQWVLGLVWQVLLGSAVLPCNLPKLQNGQTQPWSVAWFMALDPESYSLRNDLESRGVYWCDTESCLNYHRFFGRNRARQALDPELQGYSRKMRNDRQNAVCWRDNAHRIMALVILLGILVRYF